MASDNKPRSRDITLYDSISDGVTIYGFKHPNEPRNLILGSRIASPDEVLSRKKNAPDNIPLPEDVDLPDTNLLSSIHEYVAHVANNNNEEKRYQKFMDETALLALGFIIDDAVDLLLKDENSVLPFAQQKQQQQEE